MKSLVKIDENKEVYIVNDIYNFLDPKYIYIPILNKASYKKGDYVYKNTYFGEFISSISGIITSSKKVYYKKMLVPSLKISNDFKENINTRKRSRVIKNKEELLNNLGRFNLNSLINKIEEVKNIKNLVISCIDEEIYSITEFIRLTFNYEEILDTIDFLKNVLNVEKITLAIKNTNAKSINNVKSILGIYPYIKVVLIPDEYLISYKKYLCNYLFLNEEETLILKTNEVYNIYLTQIKNKEIWEKLVTISGDNLEKSLVINVKIGTHLKEVLNKFFKLKENDYEVYVNGYLNGIKVSLDDIIITEDVDTIVINKKECREVTNCINCGACYKICPESINVKKCYFNNVSSNKCIGCGLCNYICPAKIDLKKVLKGENYEK